MLFNGGSDFWCGGNKNLVGEESTGGALFQEGEMSEFLAGRGDSWLVGRGTPPIPPFGKTLYKENYLPDDCLSMKLRE